MRISGLRTLLRPMTPEEIPLFHQWVNNPDVMPHWYGRNAPKSLEELLEDWKPFYFDGSAPQMGRCFMIEVEGEPIGMIAYNKIDPQARKVEIDILIGDSKNWNKGYGTDAVRAFLGYLFNELRLHRVEVAASGNNPRAIRCYQKAGFVKEGVLRDRGWEDGSLVDEVWFGVLEDEFQPRTSPDSVSASEDDAKISRSW
jgi:ribosomal-protein-alanine N-acetyltransferase